MRGVFKDDLAGKLFHLAELSTKLAIVVDRALKLVELIGGQCHADGLLGYFASPLVAGTAARACGTILDRALTDQAEVSQTAAQALILL